MKRRDPSFDQAFADVFPRAVALARKIVGSHAAAEDVAAEAFARAFARWQSIRELEHRDAWILRVTTNLAIDFVKRKQVRVAVPEPDDAQEIATLRATLGSALRSLPRRQRQIVALRHLAGLSDSEVARALGLSLGTVKTHTRRGMEALREQLSGDDEEATSVETLSP